MYSIIQMEIVIPPSTEKLKNTMPLLMALNMLILVRMGHPITPNIKIHRESMRI